MVANGPQWGPFMPSLDRSSSLPAEGLVRFGDLQTMGRAEPGKRMLLERQRRMVAAAAVEAGGNGKCPDAKSLANPSGDSKHEGNILTFFFLSFVLFLFGCFNTWLILT